MRRVDAMSGAGCALIVGAFFVGAAVASKSGNDMPKLAWVGIGIGVALFLANFVWERVAPTREKSTTESPSSSGTEGPAQQPAGGRNAEYEGELKRRFGLVYGTGGWVFEGGPIIQEHASQLSTAERCRDVLSDVRRSVPFSEVCIVSGRVTVIVCDHTPPVCLVTKLEETAIGQTIAAIMSRTGSDVREYRGVWRMKAP